MNEITTYVLPEDSDRYLSQVLPTSNPLRITWGVLEKEEKEGYLYAALRKLENMTFVGRKVNFYQPLKFPRIARDIPPNFVDVPDEVKRAQVLLAVEIMCDELYIRRRNEDACLALGIIQSAEQRCSLSVKVNELLHRWTTSWRKV